MHVPLEGGQVGDRAGRDDHGIGCQAPDGTCACGLSCHHPDTGLRHLAGEIGDDASELGTARKHLRKTGLTAEFAFLLDECHVVPALGSRGCRLHACGPSSGHDNLQ